MKPSQHHSHLNALEIIQSKNGIFKELAEIISTEELTFGIVPPSKIKDFISYRFNQNGWADKVKVGKSNLTISFIKSKIGVCFQLGNVARTYADILKIMALQNKGVIDVGVIIVPNKEQSKKMGTNYAQYDRLVNDVSKLKDIIRVPLLIIGLSN